jgi:signal transduction histidine kinase
MLAHFIQVTYCYQYLLNQIPIGLLLYSHLPVALMALVFSTYVLVKAKSLPSTILFAICVTFTAWCVCDLSAWFSFLGSANTMFTWSLLDPLSALMFFFSYYFLYTFVSGKDLPLWQKITGGLLLLPSVVISLRGLNIPLYDLNSCTALENASYTIYSYASEAVFIVAALVFTVVHFYRVKDKEARARTILAGSGTLIFLLFFFSANFLVSQFASSDASSYIYNYLLYGLFGMPIFLIYLGYLIVRYRAFDMKMFGAQALVLALLAVLAAEYAFVTSLTNKILVAATLVLTGIVGILLIRSVKREIEQREHIQKLANELEKANKQQVALIHFITHQIKGFVTKSRNIFSMILEGDFGELPDTMRPMIEEGFKSDTAGANTIQEILNASNVKSGAVTYNMAPFNFDDLLHEIIDELKPNADAKGLALKVDTSTGPYEIVGDRMQLHNALKNIIDNAIKYTPSGEVDIHLTKNDTTLKLVEHDTGVGITPEDMQHLFTEGGHGKESIKVNVDSTGFGLYIVKNIIDAHKGHVRAESEGAGKGSTFTIELPLIQS